MGSEARHKLPVLAPQRTFVKMKEKPVKDQSSNMALVTALDLSITSPERMNNEQKMQQNMVEREEEETNIAESFNNSEEPILIHSEGEEAGGSNGRLPRQHDLDANVLRCRKYR